MDPVPSECGCYGSFGLEGPRGDYAVQRRGEGAHLGPAHGALPWEAPPGARGDLGLRYGVRTSYQLGFLKWLQP